MYFMHIFLYFAD